MTYKIIETKGIKIKVWQKSFSIDGMNDIFWPTNVTDEDIKKFVSAIYDQVEKKAIESANKKVADRVYKLLQE